jgi:hypothetical protein
MTDIWQQHWDAGHKYATEGIKVLWTLNGGGAVALLTFIGHSTDLRTKTLAAAILVFGIGALMAALDFLVAYETQLNYGNRDMPGNQDATNSGWWAALLHRVAVAIFVVSALCFTAGLVLACSGIPTR